MRLTKYGHSCIMLEKSGKKLLFDPGVFCFIDSNLKPEYIPTPDAVLITHSHADHCDAEILKKICNQETKLYSNKEVCELLQKQGIACAELKSGTEQMIEEFSVKAIDLPHGPLPIALPQNTGFLIDNNILHPGDSLESAGITPTVLMLSIAGPTVRRVDVVDSARRIKPKIVIPVHDAMIKEWWVERECATLEKLLSADGIVVKSLKVGEPVEL